MTRKQVEAMISARIENGEISLDDAARMQRILAEACRRRQTAKQRAESLQHIFGK